MPMVVRDPKNLSKAALIEIVQRIQVMMYADIIAPGFFDWDSEKEVNGGDLVEMVGRVFQEFELVPFEHGPRDWSPRKKR